MKIHSVTFLAVLVFLCAVRSQVQGATVETPLDFSAVNQSLWGGGPTAALVYEGSASVAGIGFGYDLGASSGTVNANFNGSLTADYAADLAAPGTAVVNLGFLGDTGGGHWTSDFGIWAKIDATFLGVSGTLLDWGYSLNVDTGAYTPVLGTGVGGTDEFAVEVPALSLYGAMEVGAGFDVEQASTLRGTGIQGHLNYGLEGTSISYQTDISLGAGVIPTSADLNQPGTWNFWLTDLTLNNEFSSSFDLGIFLYEKHPAIDWCSKWGIPYPCGIGLDTNGVDLANIDLFSISPFALDFNEIDLSDPLFSIQVADAPAPVPEPSTMLLLGSGLAGLAGYGRRRMKK